MNETYFRYLYSLVGMNTRSYGCFWRLMRLLYSREFRYKVRNDDNRAHDGIGLRYRFGAEYGYSIETIDSMLDGPCRVLEMLVALSVRINEELMWDPDKGDCTAFWFWQMIHSMGLDEAEFRDEYFGAESIVQCHKKVDILLDRKYERNGFGGLFPLRNPERDQRKVEIWYQANTWLNENFPLDPNKIG